MWLCLAVWLCLKMGSENMVLVRLLQIGAKDLTVFCEGPSNWGVAGEKSDPLQPASQLFYQTFNTECSNLYLNPLGG